MIWTIIISVVGQPACNCYRSVTVPNGAQVNHGKYMEWYA